MDSSRRNNVQVAYNEWINVNTETAAGQKQNDLCTVTVEYNDRR